MCLPDTVEIKLSLYLIKHSDKETHVELKDAVVLSILNIGIRW
jgi:hypothetical protein